jgi:hypothetical protein
MLSDEDTAFVDPVQMATVCGLLVGRTVMSTSRLLWTAARLGASDAV